MLQMDVQTFDLYLTLSGAYACLAAPKLFRTGSELVVPNWFQTFELVRKRFRTKCGPETAHTQKHGCCVCVELIVLRFRTTTSLKSKFPN